MKSKNITLRPETINEYLQWKMNISESVVIPGIQAIEHYLSRKETEIVNHISKKISLSDFNSFVVCINEQSVSSLEELHAKVQLIFRAADNIVIPKTKKNPSRISIKKNGLKPQSNKNAETELPKNPIIEYGAETEKLMSR
jgi:hypothetical protein